MSESAEEYARSLVLTCVRNTYLERVHEGIAPSSKTEDFSDVKVLTPYGEIPWVDVVGITTRQRTTLMEQVVGRIVRSILEMDVKVGRRAVLRFDVPRSRSGKAEAIAIPMALYCVNETILEGFHAKRSPRSKTRNFSDVKVVSPYGEIPWGEVSRFDDDQMKALMIKVVNKIYTFMAVTDLRPGLPFSQLTGLRRALSMPERWNRAEIDNEFAQRLISGPAESLR